MTPAAELRTAADKLRELAEGATTGPWGWEPSIPGQLGAQHDAGLTSPSCRLTSGDDIWIRDAVYITTMNPLVEVAGHAESNDKFDGFPPESVITGYTPAVTIARLINGSAP